MKYQIKYIIDESKTSKDRVRDIKLQLIQDNIDIVITSDYPIPVLNNNSTVFLGSTKFIVMSMVTEVTQDYYTIAITLRDEETVTLLKKKRCRRNATKSATGGYYEKRRRAKKIQ